MPSLKRIKFWSVAPPLTLKPLEASPTAFTPGSDMTTFMISTSPNAIGIFFISFTFRRSTPIVVFRTLAIFSEEIVTSFKV